MSSDKKLRWAAVLDTETTGASETDQVCEIAIVVVDAQSLRKWRKGFKWSSLIRPTCPMTSLGLAAHHIGEEELRKAPMMLEVLAQRGLPEFGRAGEGELDLDVDPEPDEVVLVAHNAEFEARMLLQSGFPEHWIPKRRICTWKCALHLVEDAPRHTNQVLRYHLKLDVPPITSLPPHRALPDAVVTAALLEWMLERRTLEELVTLTTTPILQKICKMPAHRDKPWSEVPLSYLRWIEEKGPRRTENGQEVGFDPDMLHTVRHWMAVKTRKML